MPTKKKEALTSANETENTSVAADETMEGATEKATATNYNYEDIIKSSLLKTGREGVIDLIAYIREIGFFTAPCSGGNHLCKQGGLAEHSVNVMWAAEKLSVALLGGKNITDEIRSSIVIAALLHDLGKCGDYEKALYVPNVLKSGKVSEKKPFMRNKDLSNVPHSIRSIKLATLFIDLTEDEEWAILTHDGLYDFMKYEMISHETWLSMIIHWADMWSSKIIEHDDSEEGSGEE